MRCFALPVRDITTDDQLFERLNELYKEVRDWRYFFGLCRVSRITCGRAVPDILNSTSIRKISLTLLKCCLHQFICYGSKYADYSFRTDPEGPPLPTEMPYYDYYQFDPKAWINTPQVQSRILLRYIYKPVKARLGENVVLAMIPKKPRVPLDFHVGWNMESHWFPEIAWGLKLRLPYCPKRICLLVILLLCSVGFAAWWKMTESTFFEWGREYSMRRK